MMLWFSEWSSPRNRKLLAKRFLEKIRPVPKSECIEWIGAIDNHGYGAFRSPLNKGGTSKAHRVSYWLHRGPVPPGMHIDHICRFTRCVNPYHLRLLDPRVNTGLGNVDRKEEGLEEKMEEILADVDWENLL